jgi:lipoprotein-anchoring transpeptidase ErfK/SrfK
LKFKARKDYRTTMTVYKNAAAYSVADPGNTKIRIDLSDQRAQLLVGAEEAVAIDTPVCTGRTAKPTRPGVYPITEKIVNKRSTIFGTTYYRGRRVHGGDRRQYRGRRDQYVGAPLPYWMRMTSGGIGMHGSSGVHRHPASSGCVRTPHSIIPQFFAKVKKDTPIEVVR